SGGATGGTTSERASAARAGGAGAAGSERRSPRRKTCRRKFTRASEAITQCELGDIGKPGALGLRDAAEIHRQPLPAEPDAVRETFELTERVMVVPHPARDLIGIPELHAPVQLPERVRDERLVEITGEQHLQALVRVGLPRHARLDVSRQRASLVLV